MSKISTYEVTPVPKLADKLIGTSVGGEIEDITYNFTLSELLNLFIPNIPANTLQGVLDYGNTAIQDIFLDGTIFVTQIEVNTLAIFLDTYLTGETHILAGLYDSLDSVGTAGQVLTSTGSGVEWYSIPTVIPDLQQVLTSGNTADVDILLDANLEALTVTADNVVSDISLSVNGTLKDKDALSGTAGQILSSTGTKVQWINLPVYTATTPLNINSTTKNISIQKADSTQDGYLSSLDWITFDGKQNAISLTTTGSSGPATLVGSTLNIPNYGSGLSGYVPTSRTLTINGVTYDLSADRTWTIGAGVSSVSATSPLFSTGGATPIISIQKADSSLDGYLSSADWVTFNSKQSAGNYITSLTGEATGSGPGATAVTLSNAAVIGKVLTGLNITGGTVVSTDSILTAFGKVQNQINGLTGGATYQGVWNANTNTPTLVSSVGTQGGYYVVNVAGNTNLNGITDWQVGDWAIFNGSTWNKIDNTDAVTSVNGQTGAVSLTTDNIPEGATNLYYLDSRARAALSFAAGSGAYNSTTGLITIPTNTSQLTNGANFITLSSLTASSPLSYNNTTGAFSISQATTTTDGYLSSTDWNIFNGKQPLLGGTGLVKSVAGTISYITDNSTNWNTAYNDSIVSAVVTGTSTKTLTLTQQDAGTITANWTDLGLTSVGVSMPIAFNVSNSPLTADGIIAITAAGVASQYIRGDGTLANFPTNGGGGGSVSYYLNGSVNQGTFGGNTYYEMSKIPIIGAGSDFTINANGYIAQFITDSGDPALLNIPAGNWNFEMYFSASSGGGSPSFYVELYKYDGVAFTLISSNSATPEGITNGTAIDLYTTALAVPSTALTLTDRLAIRVYVTHSGRVITLYTEDNHLCQVITTFSTGITALNGLTAQVQYFQAGTSGTDFNISSATATHTFNLPTASASVRGALSSADWTTFNNKQPAIGYTPANDALVVHLAGNETITGVKTFSVQQKFDATLALKEGASGTLAGYTVLGANVNQLIVGLVGASHTLDFPSSTNYTYTFPSATGTLALVGGAGVGTVTSVAALTLGTSGTDLSSTVANSTTTPVITLNVPTASASNRGALSSTDWSTFNGKQGAITLTTTGSSGASTLVGNTLNIPNYGSALTAYVPYTGATGNVTLGVYKLTATNIDVLGASAAIKATDTGASLVLGVNGLASSLVIGSTGDSNFYGNVYLIPAATPIVGMLKTNSSGKILAATAGTDYQAPITLTTTGTSGAATFSSGTLNIPQYQAALTNPVTGTGTTNYVTKWSSSSAVTSSVIYDNGTNIGIGTTTPGSLLTVNGDVSIGYNNSFILGGSPYRYKIYRSNAGSLETYFDDEYDISSTALNFRFRTSGTPITALRITSGGNIGIGITSGSGRLFIKQSGTAFETGINSYCSANDSFISMAHTGSVGIISTSYNSTGSYLPLTFATSDTERMRITSGGDVCINTTTSGGYKLNVNGSSSFGSVYVGSLGTGLVYSSSGTLTSTNPSDSRLKENINDIAWGLSDILKIRPVSYHWKDDKINQGVQFGFIAQEVQEIMPEAIKEFGDEVKYLGLEKDAIYAALINAIKELETRLKTLENK